MITREVGKISIECDTCDEVIDSDDGEQWAEFWARARSEGWRSKQVHGEWQNYCERCGSRR